MKKKYILITYLITLIIFLTCNYIYFFEHVREPCEILNYIATSMCTFTLGLWMVTCKYV